MSDNREDEFDDAVKMLLEVRAGLASMVTAQIARNYLKEIDSEFSAVAGDAKDLLRLTLIAKINTFFRLDEKSDCIP